MTLSIIALKRIRLSIMTLSITGTQNEGLNFDKLAKARNVVMLSVTIEPSVVSAITLNVVLLSAVVLNVAARLIADTVGNM
jgi:hypothetical protein